MGRPCSRLLGSLFQGRPFGRSWLSYGLGTENEDLPSFVVLIDPRAGRSAGPRTGPRLHAAAYQGTQLRAMGEPILDLVLAAGTTPARQRDRIETIGRWNAEHLAGRSGYSELSARIASYELACRLQSSAPEAHDIEREPAETRELNGLGDSRTADFGGSVLRPEARRARVRFIQIYSGAATSTRTGRAQLRGEETHELDAGEDGQTHRGAPQRPEAEGLLDTTLVVWGGDRVTARVTERGSGADDNPKGLLDVARGRRRAAALLGATDDLGHEAVTGRFHVHAPRERPPPDGRRRGDALRRGRNQRLTDVHGELMEGAPA